MELAILKEGAASVPAKLKAGCHILVLGGEEPSLPDVEFSGAILLIGGPDIDRVWIGRLDGRRPPMTDAQRKSNAEDGALCRALFRGIWGGLDKDIYSFGDAGLIRRLVIMFSRRGDRVWIQGGCCNANAALAVLSCGRKFLRR